MVKCPACGKTRLMELFVNHKLLNGVATKIIYCRCFDCNHKFSYTEQDGTDSKE